MTTPTDPAREDLRARRHAAADRLLRKAAGVGPDPDTAAHAAGLAAGLAAEQDAQDRVLVEMAAREQHEHCHARWALLDDERRAGTTFHAWDAHLPRPAADWSAGVPAS